jgi:hypothetical protein
MKPAFVLLTALAVCALSVSQTSAAQTETLHGTVVNYLSAVGAGGGVIDSQPNTGGITVNSSNAGIYTHGANTLVQPLGLKANGRVYLLDASSGKVISTIAKDKNRAISVKGRAIERDGATIFVVDSIG